ncbi:Maph44 [Matsumuraeses phaseoli granulovirus]|uniref:Maph44 n=1 Tax=Matsumuraeses phaseoli granulovirus TaxID=2760664 RepID=A0AAE7MLJ3_9BBAC|nr:Maph44 [Matsumuraeses phaseoli granulovirus]QOD40007.1 Maph44 [Matsumuraeses phaseoli granulovirus]
MVTTVDAKEFAKQLIADKCKVLIESENMLPDKVMAIIKKAHKDYNDTPSEANFNNIKELILQTKYVEESVEYKNFNRGTFLIALNLIVNKCQDIFPNYKTFFINASKRLEKIDPDMKSSPKDMLKHYYECIQEIENPQMDDHYMVSYAKSIVTKILYDAVADMTSVGGGAVTIPTVAVAATSASKKLPIKKQLVTLKRQQNANNAPIEVKPLFVFT